MSTANLESQQLGPHYFDPAEEQHLLAEDSEAFGGVTGILIFVVSAGLVLGILSVLIILAMG